MDVFTELVTGYSESSTVVKTVDMHTCGEPTRIVVAGYPPLHGRTLLEKRAYARAHADYARLRVMREPRGHAEMYGAVLVQETELTVCGEADIGVLFCHNEGYSTMCGHATIALGRFLVDTHDTVVFPRRPTLMHNADTREVVLRLHAPCGVVNVRVPVTSTDTGGLRSDPSRRVSFVSVPSFAAALDVEVAVPASQRWRALAEAGRDGVRVDIAYGGAYYAVVRAAELGFADGIGGTPLGELDEATRTVKALLAGRRALFEHPAEAALEYLYGVIVTEAMAERTERGVCFFAEQQVDRSPTGSGVSARVALSIARAELGLAEGVEYHSPVSAPAGPSPAVDGFRGTGVEAVRVVGRSGREWAAVRVRVEGRAFYMGAHAFVVEDADQFPVGFTVA